MFCGWVFGGGDFMKMLDTLKYYNRHPGANCFTLDNQQEWLCPTCGKSVLQIKEGTFNEQATAETFINADYISEDQVKYIYSCLLICSNHKCKEVVANTGIGGIELNYDAATIEEARYDYFVPKYFEPNLKLFSIPPDCPESVSLYLNESFKLFFISPYAALNNVRIAIEKLLTELGVPGFGTPPEKYIPLHKRIEKLPEEYCEIKSILEAVKWLGNEGSHGGDDASVDTVINAYEFMEHILQEIYQPKTVDNLKEKATEINKKYDRKKA